MSFPDSESQISKLRSMVAAARQEADFAVACREAWRPMANDTELHDRIGDSYAGNTFLTIRVGLWRELIAALMRIWDSGRETINLKWMINLLRDPNIVSKLHDEQIARRSPPMIYKVDGQEDASAAFSATALGHMKAEMRVTIDLEVAKLIAEFERYELGEKRIDFDYLKRIRHEQLAHRQPTDLTESPTDWSDITTDNFFQATMTIVRKLLGVVEAMHYDFADTASVYEHHARFFWASVRGERTPGHPDYRAPFRL